MKRRGIAVAGALSCVLAVVGARGTTPYGAIVDRNVFGLKPIPTVDLNAAPPPEVVKITLEGVTDILGHKQVIFNTPNAHPAAGQPPMKSYLLNEGESEDGIEVKSIDENAGVVVFNNNGTEQTLNLKENSAAPSGGGGGGQAASNAGRPAQGIGTPLGRRLLPTRPVRSDTSPGATYNSGTPNPYNSAAPSYSGASTYSPFGNNAAGAPGASGGAAPQAVQQPAVPAMSPEEQIIMIETGRKLHEGTEDAAILPITEVSEPGSLPPGTTIDGVDVTQPQPQDGQGQQGQTGGK